MLMSKFISLKLQVFRKIPVYKYAHTNNTHVLPEKNV